MDRDRCAAGDFRVFLSQWNALQNYTTPAIHFRIATWLQKSWARGETRLLLQAFRASGKSTLVGVFCAWILCRDPDTRILVLSAESSLSGKMTRTIKKVIERHPAARTIRPDRPEQWAADSFTVKRKRVSRDPSVLAKGLHANITGARADIIICDDVEVPNTCDTAEKRLRLRERLAENDFILVPGGRQLFVGTPHTYFSIYAAESRSETGETAPFLANCHRLSIPLIDADGQSAWPERYDSAKIAALKESSGPMKFASQMLLEPVNILNSRLDPELLRRYDCELDYSEAQRHAILRLDGRRLQTASAWWDPAFGRATGDASVLAIVFQDTAGEQWLHRMIYIRVAPKDGEDEATLQCRIVAEAARQFYLPSVAIETNGLGKFLPSILRRELDLAGVNCGVLEKHSTQNKAARILESFDALLASRHLHVHASVYSTPFIREMAEWRAGGKGHDDGLDACAGALSVNPMRLPRSYAPGSARAWTGTAGGHAAMTDFEI